MRIVFVILLLIPILSPGQIDDSVLLIARNTGEKVLATGDTIGVMGFATNLSENPGVPGPTLEFNEGDSIHIDLWNISQGAPHTIHLHGLDVDQQNDGVPHLSFEVHHMDHGDYYFKAPHAGTYLYHCHVVSSVHVQAGMYGLIIIHPPDGSQNTWDGGYSYDVSMPMFFSEIDTTWHNDSIMKHDYDTAMVMNHVEVPDYNPQFFLINGYSDSQLTDSNMVLSTSVGAVNYLRLVNLGYYGVRVIFPSTFSAATVSSDGRPLPNMINSDTVEIYPGERYGVLGTMLSEGTDLIYAEYFNLNTGIVENTQQMEIVVSGYVGLESNSSNALKVFPNPVSDQLNIVLDGLADSTGDLTIVDLRGNILYHKVVNSEKIKNLIVNLNTWESGLYFVRFQSKNESYSQKIIVQH